MDNLQQSIKELNRLYNCTEHKYPILGIIINIELVNNLQSSLTSTGLKVSCQSIRGVRRRF